MTVDEAMTKFCEEVVKLGYQPMLASEEEQAHLDDILRRNGINPVQYPIRICYFESSPRLEVFSTRGATGDIAVQELMVLGASIAKEGEGVNFNIDFRPMTLGEQLAQAIVLSPESGELRPNTGKGVIKVAFAQPPAKNRSKPDTPAP